MGIYYHGTSVLFKEFDLAHVLEGDGKVKFGYEVYVTSKYRTTAYYAGAIPTATTFYVYMVEIPEQKEDNYIAFRQPVHPHIIQKTEAKLGISIPEKMTADGKEEFYPQYYSIEPYPVSKCAIIHKVDMGMEHLQQL